MSSRKEKARAKKHGDRLRCEAWEEFLAGNAAFAKKIIARAIEEGPGNSRYWKEQGQILLELGETRAAEHSWRQALELRPDYDEVRELLASLHPDHAEEDTSAPRPPIEEERESVLTAGVDWRPIEEELFERGLACVRGLLAPERRAKLELAALASARLTLDVLHGTIGVRLESADGPWDELVAEIVAALRKIAAEGVRRLGEPPADPRDFWPERDVSPRLWRLVEGEPAELAVPRERPRFPFGMHLVLAADPAEAHVELELVDLRPGRKRHAKRVAAQPGDLLVACARERWVRVGSTPALLPVARVLHARNGTARVLAWFG